MDAKQAALLDRIMAFRFEEGPTSLTFSDRLAKENGWRIAYAERVIGEYRRFLFLAMAADHPVSPSDAVDQAWHLHLVCTRSYWGDLCCDVLRKPLHHEPTRGGAAEQAKHNDWYESTLDSYRKFFDADPPADIWPPLAKWRKMHTRYERVDCERYWLLPKLRLPTLMTKNRAGALGVIALPLVAAINPFDMRGPQFLSFFVILWGIALVLGLAIRWWNSTLQEPSAEDLAVNLEELAYLNGGQRQMIQAVVAGMIHHGVIELRNERQGWFSPGDLRLYAAKPLPGDPGRLSRLIHIESVGKSGLSVKGLPAVASPYAERVKQSLEDRGLLAAGQGMWLAGLPMAVVLLIGLAKLGVGHWREEPVGFLIAGCIVAGIAMVLLMRSSRLSGKGRAVLSSWKTRHRHLESAPSNSQGLSAAEMALAVGMFGLPATAIPELSDLRKALGPGNTSGSCGGGCGGGCGGCGGCGGD